MEISKRHRKLLQFWLKFKNTDKPSAVSYFKCQPKCYWLAMLGISSIYSIDFVIWGFNELLTGLMLGVVAQQVAMLTRFKRDWKLSRELLQWNRVEELANEDAQQEL